MNHTHTHTHTHKKIAFKIYYRSEKPKTERNEFENFNSENIF